jgi:HSP20 family molecular chaperone IbpA
MPMLPKLRDSNCSCYPSIFDEDFFNFDSIFDRFWLDHRNHYPERAKYYYDEEKKEHVILAQAAGFKKDDIEVEVDDTGIYLNGNIKEENKNRFGERKFSYRLGKPGIDTKTVDAVLEDGILTIKFKTKEEKISKKIEIQEK